MTIIDRPTIFIDVDETLVAWHCTYFKPMQNNIDSLIRHAERGHYVVVWSAGGHEWAARVVKELGLADYVDLVMTKPRWYLDDMPADSWMARYWDKQGSADGEAKDVDVHTKGSVGSVEGISNLGLISSVGGSALCNQAAKLGNRVKRSSSCKRTR